MPFTLPWGINYYVSTHINNGNAITGTSGNVSLKVNGNTELAATLIVGDLALTKFPTCTDAATPTSTNLITKSYADANYTGSNILTSVNTWTDVNTFQKPIVLSNKITGQTAQIYSITTSPLVVNLAWGSAENVIIIPAATGSGTQAIVNLPSIATANIGTSFLIMTGGLQYAGSDSVLIQNSNVSFNLLYDNQQWNALWLDMGTGYFPTSPYGYRFTAVNTSQLWIAAPFDFKKTAITYSGNVWQGTNSFNSHLPTSTISSTTSGTQFMTRNLNDARYGQLTSANTWTAQQTFSLPLILSNNITGQKAQIYTVSATQLVINPAWGSEENIIIIPSGTGSAFGVGYVNLPSITSSNIGTTFYIMQGGVGNSSSDYIQIGTVAGGTTLLYRGTLTTSVYIDMGSGVFPNADYGYKATAKDTSQTWIISALDFNANQLLNGANAWTGTNTFNSALPTSTISSSSSGNQFMTRSLNDGRYGRLSSSNAWSSTNSFDSALPTSSISSTTGGSQFLTRSLNDARYGRLNTGNTWGSTNAFDTNLPTSTIATTTGGTQFLTRSLNDARYGQLGTTNTWSMVQTFSSAPVMSGASISSATIPYASLASDVRLIKTGNSYNYYTSIGLTAITTGDYNTIYGAAGAGITDGGANTLFGLGSGNRCGTSSSYNVSIGFGSMGYSLAAREICSYNTAVGTNSLGAITNGTGNCIYGWNGANSLTTGSFNSFYGSESGINVTAGNLNTGVGYRCNYTSPVYDGSNNTFLGANSALSASVSNVTCIGANTLCATASTIQLGSNSEIVAISGSFKSGSNTITATQLGYLSTVSGGIVDTSSNLTIAGTKTFNSAPVMSGASIQAATIKTGLIGTANESAIKDLYIDTSANCALGNDSMISITTGVGNCALSTRALKFCTTGDNNMGIGTQALSSLTTGIQNVGISTGALQSYNGSSSVGIGAYSGSSLTSGNENVMIGYYAAPTATSASSTVCIGNNAGSGSTTLNSCVFIGNGSTTSGTKSNVIVIGAGQATASNDCIIGDVNNNVKIAGTLAVTGTINSVSSTVFGYISGLTSSAQTQINNILNGTSAITLLNYNSIFRPYSVATIASTAALTTPLAGTYLWAAAASYSATLPAITTAMIGISINFRRITTSNTNTLSLIAGASNSIVNLNAVTTVANPTAVILLTSNATPTTAFSGRIICINSTQWAIM